MSNIIKCKTKLNEVIICILICLLPLFVNAQRNIRSSSLSNSIHNHINKLSADSAWGIIFQPLPKIKNNNIINYTIEKEISNRNFYANGLALWDRFPGDDRRYKWLKALCSHRAPNYWIDIEEGAVASTDSRFYSAPVDLLRINSLRRNIERMKSELLKSGGFQRKDMFNLNLSVLSMELNRSRNRAYLCEKATFLNQVKTLLEETVSQMDSSADFWSVKRTMEILFMSSTNFNVSISDLKEFVSYFQKSPYASLRKWSMQKMNLFAFETEPFKFRGKTTDGQVLDIASYRGKVVLVDIWSLGCSECIMRMPEIKKVYDKNRSRDFEVISICLNERKYIEQALIVKRKIGATWPLVLIDKEGNDDSYLALTTFDEIWTSLGFGSVPQLFLLNKNGNLALLNGTLLYGNLEDSIEEFIE